MTWEIMSGKDKQYNLIEANRIALEHDCITLQFTFMLVFTNVLGS